MIDFLKTLDQTDKQILQILQTDAKITNSQLAKEIGLSPAPTLERVRKLETSGVIESYHAVLSPEKMGVGVGIYLSISLSSHKKNQINALVEKMSAIDAVVECHHVTGVGDFLIKILAKDSKTCHELILNQLVEIEEIGNMQSMIILKTYKNEQTFNVN
ncbi:MAG: Lrp/AsnC family transcriptional regulator [Cyclobacteriaceae bacterium]